MAIFMAFLVDNSSKFSVLIHPSLSNIRFLDVPGKEHRTQEIYKVLFSFFNSTESIPLLVEYQSPGTVSSAQ